MFNIDENKLKSAMFTLLSSLAFILYAISIRHLKEYNLSVAEMSMFRHMIVLALTLLALKRIKLDKVSEHHYFKLFLRGMSGSIAMIAVVYSMATLPVGTALTYLQSSAIFMVIFGFLFFGEKISKIAIFSIFIGFIGVAIIAKPSENNDLVGSIFGIAGAMFASFSYLLVKNLKKYYHSDIIVLAFAIIGTIFYTILVIAGNMIDTDNEAFLLITNKFILPTDTIEITWLIILGISATAGQMLLTRAFIDGISTSFVGVLGYIEIPLGIIMGYIFLSDSFPDMITLAGMVLTIISGIMVIIFK